MRKFLLFLLLFTVVCGVSARPVWQWHMRGRSYAEPVIDGNIVYIVTQAGEVAAGLYGDGERIWEKKISGPVVVSPAILRDRLFVATQNGDVVALEKKTGNQIWRKSLGAENGFEAPPAVSERLLLLPSISGTLFALSPANGSVLWSNAGHRRFNVRPTIDRDYIFVGGWDNQFFCFRSDGSIEWQFHTNNPVVQDALQERGRIYFATADGFVYALDSQNGRLLWRYAASKPTNLGMIQDQLIFASKNRLIGLRLEDGIDLQNLDFKTQIYRLYVSDGVCFVVTSKVLRVDPDFRRMTVVISTRRPVFKLAYGNDTFVVSDDLYSIYGYRR